MMQLRYSGSWCSKCPLRKKKKKEGKRWGSGWMRGLVTGYQLSLLPLGHSFKFSLGHECPQAPCHCGVTWPCRPGHQVSPALHVALIHNTVSGWSQERPEGNKPALEGWVCWDLRPVWATAMPMTVKDTSSSSWKEQALQAGLCLFRGYL